MSSKRKSKRNFSDREDYGNQPGSEDESEFCLKRPTKKKRICLDSGSESESGCLDKNFLKNSENLEDTSDDDKPISNIIKKKASELKEKSKQMQHYSSDSSEEEPITNKYRKPSENSNDQNIAKSLHSGSEDELGTTDEKEIGLIATSTKLRTHNSSSCNSDDETDNSRKSPKYLKTDKKTAELDSEADKTKSEMSSDEEPLSEMLKSSKTNGNSKEHHSSSSSDDDAPLATKVTAHQKVTSKNNRSAISSDEESLSDVIKSSKTNGNSKEHHSSSSSDDDDDEPLATKVTASQKRKSNNNRSAKSSDEEPLSEMIKSSKTNGNSKEHHSSSSSDDDEPLATKVTAGLKVKSKDNSDLSSDDEEKPLSSVSKTLKEKVNEKKNKNPSNGKIEHLKKYLRVAGIHVNSYDKLFENCKSIKSKVEKLLGLLHDKGLKGRPTIEKCKKLKKKIETKKEIADLDISNIIKSEGRPKRGSGGKIIEKIQNSENSPAAKKFMRLRDIIDSEESD